MHSKTLPVMDVGVVRRPEHIADIEETVGSLLDGLPGDKPESHLDKYQELQEYGFSRLSIPEEHGGSGGDLADLGAVLRACGYAGLNAPLLEEVLSAWLLAEANITLDGRQCVAVNPTPGNPFVKWADEQRPCVVLTEEAGRAWLHVAEGRSTPDRTFAGEPLGLVDWEEPSASKSELNVNCSDVRLKKALMRSAMLVGAAECAFNLSLKYSAEREQFGRVSAASRPLVIPWQQWPGRSPWRP